MSISKEETHTLVAKKLWQYLSLNQTPVKSDILIGLGSSDKSVAQLVARLYQQKYADYVLLTGGVKHFHQDWRGLSEAQYFANILFQETDILKERVLLEEDATNTGENIKFSHQLLESKTLPTKSLLVASKPHLQRRVRAAFQKQWPNGATSIRVVAAPISYERYVREVHNVYSKENFIDVLVKNVRKIIEYPQYGYQLEEEVPADILDAYKLLISQGYG